MLASRILGIVRSCNNKSPRINRCRTTYRNSQEHGINIFDKSHTERLKYKYKDKFFEQELQNPITKSDKEMLRDFLHDGKKIRKPSDLEDVDEIVK
ncbi:hypothetical protein TSAR_000773 [Trichomalopsis sarcophagae]|uniref:Uncharacterized protein n=1 Tax=Trichomalopsis sarcophagae TaxID=543379 RepID=A0A232EWA5_9HYME|nr:hypothetical protein TSAR_000773 [Trichomalopsis sarcophagae]